MCCFGGWVGCISGWGCHAMAAFVGRSFLFVVVMDLAQPPDFVSQIYTIQITPSPLLEPRAKVKVHFKNGLAMLIGPYYSELF